MSNAFDIINRAWLEEKERNTLLQAERDSFWWQAFELMWFAIGIDHEYITINTQNCNDLTATEVELAALKFENLLNNLR